MDNTVYDIIGIGIGPFNLGMAAMCEKLPLNCIFFDQNPVFDWHPGMMLPNARMQVPFYADLVTIVDPTSKYTFLNYLKENQRLFKFAIHENNFITRREYNDYCKWVVNDLDTLRFNHKVLDVKYETPTAVYIVSVLNQISNEVLQYYCKNIVVGIGTVPHVPDCARHLNDSSAFHSSQYLFKKHVIKNDCRVTIIGSGQSAAEIFYDLLGESERLKQLSWYTSSERFYPMEYSKLTLEMTSPDYINHFYSLFSKNRAKILEKQKSLYKGINYSLINEIYDCLYLKDLRNSCNNIHIQANATLFLAEQKQSCLVLHMQHKDLECTSTWETDTLILATGYQCAKPEFLNGILDKILFDEQGMYAVRSNYSIDEASTVFIQNAESHTHGFSGPDLGMGPYRNAHILNSILRYERFETETHVCFQRFR